MAGVIMHYSGEGSVNDERLTETDSISTDIAERLLRAFNRAPSMVVTFIDADLRTQWISRSATWVTGTDPDSRKGKGSLERLHPDDIGPLLHALDQLRTASSSGTAVPVIEPLRYRVRRADGSWFAMESLVLNLLDDPEVNGLVILGRPASGESDGTARVVDLLVAEAPLPDILAACARLVPDYLGSAAVVARVDGQLVTGAAPGSPAARLVKDERWWAEALADGKARTPREFEGFPPELAERAREEGFGTFWVSPLTDLPTHDVVGCVVTWVWYGAARNVATDTGVRHAERLAGLVIGEERRRHDLRLQATTDPLTGLANRVALRRRLDGASGPLTVALLDLDRFKPVNDQHGHHTGDAVLQVIGERLQRAVRDEDLVVRFGGDEFAVVFADGTTREGAMASVERIVEVVEAPISLWGLQVGVGISAGVATAEAQEVLHRADAALYRTKRQR